MAERACRESVDRIAGVIARAVHDTWSRRPAGLASRMRLSLIVASGTWLLALGLRALAKAHVETVENPQHIPSPTLAWLEGLGRPSMQVPVISSVIVLLTICAIVLVWWRLRPTPLAATGLGLFIGAAASNTTEQRTFGGVTDYIPISWPNDYIVNFPDVAIVAGSVLLAIALVCSLTRR